jgi:hypothetical protein
MEPSDGALGGIRRAAQVMDITRRFITVELSDVPLRLAWAPGDDG